MAPEALMVACVAGGLAWTGLQRDGDALGLRIEQLLDRMLPGRGIARMEDACGPALRLFADAVDSGATISGAAAKAARGDGPAAAAMHRFAIDLAGGLSLQACLTRLTSRRCGSVWADFAFTLELNALRGGDLAAALRSVAGRGEEALRASREAETATAQARFTANLICALPLLAVCGSELVFPGRLSAAAGNPVSAGLAALGALAGAVSLVAIRWICRSEGRTAGAADLALTAADAATALAAGCRPLEALDRCSRHRGGPCSQRAAVAVRRVRRGLDPSVCLADAQAAALSGPESALYAAIDAELRTGLPAAPPVGAIARSAEAAWRSAAAARAAKAAPLVQLVVALGLVPAALLLAGAVALASIDLPGTA